MNPAKAPAANTVEAICKQCQQQLDARETLFAFNTAYIVWCCPQCGCRFIAPANNKADDDNERTIVVNTPKRIINDMKPWKSNVHRPVEERGYMKRSKESEAGTVAAPKMAIASTIGAVMPVLRGMDPNVI